MPCLADPKPYISASDPHGKAVPLCHPCSISASFSPSPLLWAPGWWKDSPQDLQCALCG